LFLLLTADAEREVWRRSKKAGLRWEGKRRDWPQSQAAESRVTRRDFTEAARDRDARPVGPCCWKRRQWR